MKARKGSFELYWGQSDECDNHTVISSSWCTINSCKFSKIILEGIVTGYFIVKIRINASEDLQVYRTENLIAVTGCIWTLNTERFLQIINSYSVKKT